MTSRSASSSANARCDCPRDRVLLEPLTSDFQQTAWYGSGVLGCEGER